MLLSHKEALTKSKSTIHKFLVLVEFAYLRVHLPLVHLPTSLSTYQFTYLISSPSQYIRLTGWPTSK